MRVALGAVHALSPPPFPLRRRGVGLIVQASGGYYQDGVFVPVAQPPAPPVNFSNPTAVTQAVLAGNPQATTVQQAYDQAYFAKIPASQWPELVQGGGSPYMVYLASLQNPGGAISINSNILAGSGVPVQTAVTMPAPQALGVPASATATASGTTAPATKPPVGSGVTQTDVHGTSQAGITAVLGHFAPAGTCGAACAGMIGCVPCPPGAPSFQLPAFLTDTTIDSIPNWMLILGAIGAFYFFGRAR